MERLCRLRADEDACRSLGGTGQYRPAARLRRQSVLQRADEIQAALRSRNRWPSDVSLANLWRHVARMQPDRGHAASQLLALRHLPRRLRPQKLGVEDLRK